MSPLPPPEAATGLLVLTVSMAEGGPVIPVVSIFVKELAGAFELIPPPVKYVKVKLVLTGAVP